MSIPETTPAGAGRENRVAVIIPCFNEGQNVVVTWCSLAAEEPHEAVIVDDGSDDGETRECLDLLRQTGARVIRRENGGLAAARMTGVGATSAPYVFSLDGDDVLAPGALARLADALDRDAQSMAAWGDLRVFGTIDRIDPKGARLDPWLLTHVHDLHAGLMLRREALAEVGGWRDVVFEDWDLTLALAERGWSGSYVPGAQIYYRVDAGGLLAQAPYARGIAELRSRHSRLFASRRRLEADSSVPWSARRAISLVDRVPALSAARRAALKDAVLRRLDARRRVTTPPVGLPSAVLSAQRRADELMRSARPGGRGGPQAAESRQ